MRLRKRVTLMVATVSAVFGVCWGADSTVYILRTFAPYNIGPMAVAVTQTMVLLNSAANPFVYALLNQRFKEKIKAVVCCNDPLESRLQASRRGTRSIELPVMYKTTHPTLQRRAVLHGVAHSL